MCHPRMFWGELACDAWALMYKGDVSICVPVSAVARLCASDVDMPGWHEGSVGGSNCKTGLGMGQASGKISCHLVPMKKAGGHRE